MKYAWTQPLVVIIVCAVFIRLIALTAALWNMGVDPLIAGDAIGYLDLAKNLITGHGFAMSTDGGFVTEVFRTPGFPVMIAPFTLTAAPFVVYGICMSIAAGVLLPFLTFGVARRFVSLRASYVAAILIALEPHAVMYSFLLLTEVPFMIFGLAGALTAFVAYERSSYRFAMLAGVLLGYAVFIRPGFYSEFILVLVLATATLAYMRDVRFRHIGVITLVLIAVLMPWQLRNRVVTGTASLSGAGWRNVYTDFLASTRALERGTTFHDEKDILKNEAATRFGLSRDDINSPANSSILRDAALSELWQHKLTVLKLEATLGTQFFIQDGYYYEFRALGYVGDSPGTHISPTYELLTNGIRGIPAIFVEMARQRFIPLLGRVFTVSVLIAAGIGFVLVERRIKYAFALIILLTGLFATVIGLGLDARMRVPVEPLFFIFASAAFVALYDLIRLRYAH